MSRALCWKKRTHDLSACADPEQDHRGKGQVHKGTFGTRGKIGISDTIINKTERLTDEEYEEIKKHPVIGAKILSDISEMPDIQDGARWHHERYGGAGYPDGLSGNDISEIARIIGVADAYDAMTSTRSYRDCLPQDVVRGEIERGSGKQFDPQFADIMLHIIDEDKEYELKQAEGEK